jgi:hypothetical protein
MAWPLSLCAAKNWRVCTERARYDDASQFQNANESNAGANWDTLVGRLRSTRADHLGCEPERRRFDCFAAPASSCKSVKTAATTWQLLRFRLDKLFVGDGPFVYSEGIFIGKGFSTKVVMTPDSR